MMLRILLLNVIFTLAFSSLSQEKNEETLDIDQLMAQEDKPLLLFFTAEWCRYCNAMKDDVFKNDSIAAIIDNDFHYIEINEAMDSDVKYDSSIYSYFPTGLNTGYHEFITAYAKVNGRVSFPTVLILYKNEEVFKYSSFLSTEELMMVLKRTMSVVDQD